MLSRRHFLGTSLGTAAIAPFARSGNLLASMARKGPALPLSLGAPILKLPDALPSIDVGGLPFAETWTGDAWENEDIPFHGPAGCDDGRVPIDEETDVVVIGGGVSGLCSALLLAEHRPIVLEMRDRFGGVAQGEQWGGTPLSLGNAYVITPDPGTFLNTFYRQLGLHEMVRVDYQDPHIELDGRILDDFFDPATHPRDKEAFNVYRQVVQHMANVEYPDIPLPDSGSEWIVELDRKTLRQDIEDRMGVPVPPALASSIQAYCYSSFAAGWEEISAAGGWNFLAAEEFGRWVFPGGTAYMADRIWNTLRRRFGEAAGDADRPLLRPGCRVADVRLVDGDRVKVTYVDHTKKCRAILAKRVVVTSPKFIAQNFIHDLSALDSDKNNAITDLRYRPYVVANVLVDAPVDLDFYDVFLLGDGHLPMNQEEAAADSRVTDMLNGHYFNGPGSRQSVLTLYWPLPFDSGRWTLLINDSWQTYAESLVPQIEFMLERLGVTRRAVRQVRMTRWAHAMPLNEPGLMASGKIEALRRPIEDRIFFVNQDNWALPAVENCLLDAEIFVPQVVEGL